MKLNNYELKNYKKILYDYEKLTEMLFEYNHKLEKQNHELIKEKTKKGWFK